MDTRVHIADRLRHSFDPTNRHAVATQIADLLSPRTPEELERRRAHLLALLLVAIVGAISHVTGWTDRHAQYTVYVVAIAVAAVVGGTAPGCVAALAAVLLASADAGVDAGAAARVTFALEGLGVAWVVGSMSGRLRDTTAQLASTVGANGELSRQVHRGHMLRDAFEQLESTSEDAAVFTVNARGLIVEWPRSAARMYGFRADQALGSNVSIILDAARPGNVQQLLSVDTSEDVARSVGVHRRSDGSPVHVEFQVKPCSRDAEHVTIAVHDLSRRRETDAFRDAAIRAQAALQQAVDVAQGQLEMLESLTDPSVSVSAGPGAINELLERLRSTVGAGGVALVQVGRMASRLVAAAGLRPGEGAGTGAAVSGMGGDNRVALIHNDPARVAQVSALKWSPTVSSILVVPVCQSGSVAFRLELVNERRAPASEWDLALARIVADRLAYAMLLRGRDSEGAVA
jgi:PAS domain S-box-containing protein